MVEVQANGFVPLHLDENFHGNPLSIGTTTYPKGIWTNSPAKISQLPGRKLQHAFLRPGD